MIRAEDIMTPNPITVKLDESVAKAAKIMSENKIGSVIVVDSGGKPIGIVTSHDILEKVVARGLNPNEVSVGRVMSSPLIYVDASTPIDKVIEVMLRAGIRHVPVMKGERLVGIIAEYDIIALGPEIFQALELFEAAMMERARRKRGSQG
ncbi:MAG: CBS domain-containing protein [Sulfolobales archaeon]